MPQDEKRPPQIIRELSTQAKWGIIITLSVSAFLTLCTLIFNGDMYGG
jgi:hypothetical protein